MKFLTVGAISVAALFILLLLFVAHAHAQTQAHMDAEARADFARADADLNKTYQSVLAKLPNAESKQKLKETQRAWIASRDAQATRAAKEAAGGSMAPTLRYEAMTRLTQERIKDLKAMLDDGTASPSKGLSNNSTPSPRPTPQSQPEKAQSPSETEPTAELASHSVSPDKKWEFVGGETPKLVNADTKDVAIDFSEQCDLGTEGQDSRVLWAPDSRRLAFYSCGAGKEHSTLLYQLRNGQWAALERPANNDEISDRTEKIIQAQAKAEGLAKGTALHLLWWKVEPRQWLNASTLIVYASLEEVHRGDGDDILGFGANVLFTLKFDDAGNWKIVNAHEMTGKAAESPSRSTPLADKVLFQSPQGNYRIQASADGTALWIVSAEDANQRKPLAGADPDNRSAEEFSASPDENWLFDNRQHELYRHTGDFAFSVFTGKRWFAKKASDYSAKEVHFARGGVSANSAGWSFDSARMLTHLEAQLQHRFVCFNTRTKAFEQTPYLRMVNAKLNTERPYEAFPQVAFEGERLGSYVVFAEPIDSPPSEAILKTRLAALGQELQTLREKRLADLARRGDSTIVEFRRSQNDEWNKARDEAVQLYLPFAPKAEQEIRKLQFLCDLTQREVNGLKEVVAPTAADEPAAQSPSPAASPQ